METKLLKKYSETSKKIRRVWVNLFREFKVKPSNFFSKLQPIVCIMAVLFVMSVGAFFDGTHLYYLPFLIGWLFVATTFVYFKFFPMTWDEMTEQEKKVYRLLNNYPSDWEPKN